jgi:hypothetical protein
MLGLSSDSDFNKEHDVIIYVVLEDEFDDSFILLGGLIMHSSEFRYRRRHSLMMGMIHDLNCG